MIQPGCAELKRIRLGGALEVRTATDACCDREGKPKENCKGRYVMRKARDEKDDFCCGKW